MSHIPVGISSCLLGQAVRHDGGHKHSRFCTGVLAEHFSFQPMCPELEAGLGVPRPTIHIRDIEGELRLVESKGSTDHTHAMQHWIEKRIPDIRRLRGYILMAKSPSCGMERIKVHNAEGRVIHREGRGLFAEALIEAYPLMPIEEEGRLNDSHLCENFIERVFAYDDWMNRIEAGLTPSALVDFHTRHKFQLMAHCNQTYQQLGRLVADLKSAPINEIADEYIGQFMAAMKKHIRRGSHANVMQHMMGFLRDALSASDRQVITEQIEAYRSEQVPLVVPMTLLMMAQRRAPADYLSRQDYLSPYPEQLGLRNKV